MNRLKALFRGILPRVANHRWLITAGTLVLVLVFGVSWFVGLASTPARRVGDPVSLTPHGIPDVELQIVHPALLSAQESGIDAVPITVLARALTPNATEALDLVFVPSAAALAFVDSTGSRVPGRMSIVPGHPDALPHDLNVAHGNTQLRARVLRPYRVNIEPQLRVADQTIALSDLAFAIRLESRWRHSIRLSAESFSAAAVPYVLFGSVLVAILWGWRYVDRRRDIEREKDLSSTYRRVRENIRLEQWPDARQGIDRIREVRPSYRDTDQLDTLVSAAESAAWRREQLYRVGLKAYQSRDWPSACQAFFTVEQETPYFHDVRFFRRTASLYADLTSRDRSLRVQAARELGQIADLIDMVPLLNALGDPSEGVAQATEQAFQEIGIQAFDTLLSGLCHRSPRVRTRAYGLIEGYGQSARDLLIGALRSSDPQITQAVARLLMTLGSRAQVAQSLLRLPHEHWEGIASALVSEGIASVTLVLDLLLQAPSERQQLLIDVIAAIKVDTNIDRRLADAVRAARDPQVKDLLQRAQSAPPASFHTTEAPPIHSSLPARITERR